MQAYTGRGHERHSVKRISLDEQIARSVRPWIPTALGEVDDHLVYVAHYRDGSPTIYASGNKFHSHDGGQLLIVLSGKVVFEERNGKRHECVRGDALFVERGESHRASAPEGAHVLHVQSKAVARAFKEEFDRGPEVVAG